jgi:hypothetical protein
MTLRRLEIEPILALLLAHPSDVNAAASRIAESYRPLGRITAAVQPAAQTARTFAVKYQAAQERGAFVVGLDDLVRALEARDTRSVVGLNFEGTGEFALIFLEEDLSRLVGSLYVRTLEEPGVR